MCVLPAAWSELPVDPCLPQVVFSVAFVVAERTLFLSTLGLGVLAIEVVVFVAERVALILLPLPPQGAAPRGGMWRRVKRLTECVSIRGVVDRGPTSVSQ